MADFATITDLENFLQVAITTPEQIAAAARALSEASAAIRGYCHQYLSRVSNEKFTLDCFGGNVVFLPELPAISVSKVVVDGATLANTAYKLGKYGFLHRLNSQVWPKGVQNVEVTYTHGYNPIPDDIRGVCARAASRAYQAGLRAADSDAVSGVASKSLGDFSVAYGGEGGEGVMGASAARMLLLSEKDILDSYRIVGP